MRGKNNNNANTGSVATKGPGVPPTVVLEQKAFVAKGEPPMMAVGPFPSAGVAAGGPALGGMGAGGQMGGMGAGLSGGQMGTGLSSGGLGGGMGAGQQMAQTTVTTTTCAPGCMQSCCTGGQMGMGGNQMGPMGGQMGSGMSGY